MMAALFKCRQAQNLVTSHCNQGSHLAKRASADGKAVPLYPLLSAEEKEKEVERACFALMHERPEEPSRMKKIMDLARRP